MEMIMSTGLDSPIAVATDFSPASEHALVEAMAIARQQGVGIHLIHVLARLESDDETEEFKALDRAIQAAAHNQLEKLHAKFDGQGVVISQSLIDGFVPEALGKTAIELGCGLVVMATHGRSGLRRFLLGSIAEKVARDCTLDLLISRGSRPTHGYERLMVPTDFSPPAEVALKRAVEMAAPNATIDLIHTWQFPTPVTHQYAPLGSHTAALDRISMSIREQAEAQGAELISRYQRKGISITFTSINGSPAPTIIERANDCDLIAMGTHGRHGFKRLMLGSIAEKTIRHAPCSVLTTHAETNHAETH